MSRTVGKALAVWLLLVGVEIVHGTLRTLFLEPRLGSFFARQLSVATGSCLILLTTYTFIRWIGIHATRGLLALGAAWTALMLAFELGAGHYLAGRGWSDLGADFAFWRGGMLVFGMIVLLLAPLIADRARKPRH